MRVVDQETGEELPDTRPPREPREGGDRPRGDRDRGPRRDGDRGPRREGGGRGGDRGPRRERSERSEGGNDDGPAPEFAPAFLTRNDD
jgi:polyribonucleotide nucleotidyltransferase